MYDIDFIINELPGLLIRLLICRTKEHWIRSKIRLVIWQARWSGSRGAAMRAKLKAWNAESRAHASPSELREIRIEMRRLGVDENGELINTIGD